MKVLLPASFTCFALLLCGCENEAASHMIDGKDHSISLTREQRWIWASEVQQRLVVARFPTCQRRFEITPGKTGSVNIELYGVAPMLFVAHQGADWYALSTEQCQLQKFETPPPQYGQLIGVFQKKGGKLEFVNEANK